jgi:RNA polymerase sigma-70 factor (ECF subfamily)
VDGFKRNTTEVEALYRQHGPALLLFAASIIGDRASAQDAVHQVFLRLIERNDLSRAADTKAYLFTCVRNAVLTARRVSNRNSPIDPEAIRFISEQRDFAEEVNLKRALVALPEDQREVIVLHIWGELTFSQIGELLGVSLNTAASRYRYALAKLKESMFRKENLHANSGR